MVNISQRVYGRLQDGREVAAIQLQNGRLTALFIDYGLRLISLEYQLDSGIRQQLVQGGWPVEFYETDTSYQGAVVGRTCNRIQNGELVIGSATYQLDQNEGVHHLHGGYSGLHNRLWETQIAEHGLICQTLLVDGESGYPGNVEVEVEIRIEDDVLIYEYSGQSDTSTLLDMTNHAYFCLDNSGSILDHELMVNGGYFVPVDQQSIPLGKLAQVEDSLFDLRESTRLGSVLGKQSKQLELTGGIDHSWLLSSQAGPSAVLRSNLSGIELSVSTSQPALQVYSGNYLSTPHSAVCLETQHLPDACHHRDFSAPLLEAGEVYKSWTRYQFKHDV